MKTRHFFILVLLLLVMPSLAQKNKIIKPTPENQEQQEKFQRMIAKTQRIVFIDSIVVDKQQFLDAYKLSPEMGRIARYNDVFNNSKQKNAMVFINELGTHCYFSEEKADSSFTLLQSEMIDNEWSAPSPLVGINEGHQFKSVSYPFMMADGQTLYFAAKGGDGLGGYDIYVTRYNADENKFLHPTNIGMPFNSTANDYLYIIDEYNNLGWFATDRRQAADSVCIYTFIPSNSRRTYSDDFSLERIESFSRIDRIADTWNDKTLVDNALQRKNNAAQQNRLTADAGEFRFIINDDLVYTRMSDFHNPSNQQNFQRLTTMKNQYDRLQSTLNKAREDYATASRSKRNQLSQEILDAEQKKYQLYLEIHNMEKNIRNAEIIYLTNTK